jgi:broad specificity phosphatase PhoE
MSRVAAVKKTPPWVTGRVLHFVRHGQYETDDAGMERLTALGRKQAARLAKHFAPLPIDIIVSSDMPRAMETARILADGLGIRGVRRLRVLRELLPAPVPGMKIPRQRIKEGAARLDRVVKRFFKASRETRHEIVVCHGNLIRALLVQVSTGRLTGWHRFVVHNGGVTSFAIAKDGIRVLGYNVQEHVPLRLRSYT